MILLLQNDDTEPLCADCVKEYTIQNSHFSKHPIIVPIISWSHNIIFRIILY